MAQPKINLSLVLRMKHLIFILGLLICTSNVQAQETPDLITTVLGELDFAKSEVNMGRATKQEISGMPDKSIVVIPKIAETDQKSYMILDAYVLLVDNKTGQIEAKFVDERAWTSDAYILYDIEIQHKPYILNEETKAFGIILVYESDSRVNRFGERALSLFALSNKSLVRILKDYPLISTKSESGVNCNSEYEIRTRHLKVTDTMTNQYNDLKVIDNVEKGKSTEENCEPHTVTKTQNIEYLKFRNGKYQSVSN